VEFYAAFPQFTRTKVQFKGIEAKSTHGWYGSSHSDARKSGKPTTILSPWGLILAAENVFVFNRLGMEKTLGMEGGGED